MSYCSTVIVGTIGNIDPIKDTANSKYVRVSVVTDERYKDEVKPMWHRVTFWGKSAETVAAHFKRGSGIMVECDLRYSDYTKKDGTEVHAADLTALRFTFLNGSKPRKSAGAEQKSAPPAAEATGSGASAEGVGPQDDVPF